MSNSDDRNVRIRISIDVPITGGEPHIESRTGDDRRPKEYEPLPEGRVRMRDVLGINIPGDDAQAIWHPDKQTGYICAMGLADQADVCAVAAIVKEGLSPVIPDCIPGEALISSLNPSGGWEFTGDKLLPGVVGYPYQTPHTLIMWKIVKKANGDQYWTLDQTHPFNITWSDETDCGDGLPCPPAAQAQFQPQSPTVVQNAAVAWTVSVAGFQGQPVDAFNGNWNLQLAPPDRQIISYNNGGDGIKTPRVELRCESACKPKWVLVFAVGGVAVHYTKPIDKFQTNAANTLSDVTTMGLHASVSLPEYVSLTPM